MTDPDDIAVVLKALEIRAARQGSATSDTYSRATAALREASSERLEWDELAALVGVSPGVVPPPPALARPAEARLGVPTWESALEQARRVLREEGFNPEDVRLDLPDALDRTDVVASLCFGALGAVVPSLGSRGGLVQDAFGHIQKMADSYKLPTLVQDIFGSSTPAPFMDAGAKGMYHRFVHGHDLLWALPEGVSELGLFRGIIEVFQHLLRDSFGLTGIPLPGSTQLAETIAGQLGRTEVSELIVPRDLSRYAGFRMTDAVSAGTTSLLLWGYGRARDIPSPSPRSVKLAILAHGLCSIAVAAIAAIPVLRVAVPHRSHINYVSLAALGKNTIQLWQMSRQAQAGNLARFAKLESELNLLLVAQERTLGARLDAEIRTITDSSPDGTGVH